MGLWWPGTGMVRVTGSCQCAPRLGGACGQGRKGARLVRNREDERFGIWHFPEPCSGRASAQSAGDVCRLTVAAGRRPCFADIQRVFEKRPAGASERVFCIHWLVFSGCFRSALKSLKEQDSTDETRTRRYTIRECAGRSVAAGGRRRAVRDRMGLTRRVSVRGAWGFAPDYW